MPQQTLAPNPPPRPWWVRAPLWNLHRRAAAMFFVWVCLALAIIFVMAAGIWYGLVFVAGAIWYWLAARWVDRHGRWE